MSPIYLPWNASKARVRAAQQARKHRQDIVKALSHGQVSRRDLIKIGLFTSAGLLAPIKGLNPFVGSASAQTASDGPGAGIPTGMPRSPMFGVQPFSQAMPRFDVLPRYKMSELPAGSSLALNPPTEYSNQTPQQVAPELGGGWGPIEGRPPGPMWSHQGWSKFAPKIGVDVTSCGAAVNNVYNSTVADSYYPAGASMNPCFHPDLPVQD